MLGKNATPIIKDCMAAIPRCIPTLAAVAVHRYDAGTAIVRGTKRHSNTRVAVAMRDTAKGGPWKAMARFSEGNAGPQFETDSLPYALSMVVSVACVDQEDVPPISTLAHPLPEMRMMQIPRAKPWARESAVPQQPEAVAVSARRAHPPDATSAQEEYMLA